MPFLVMAWHFTQWRHRSLQWAILFTICSSKQKSVVASTACHRITQGRSAVRINASAIADSDQGSILSKSPPHRGDRKMVKQGFSFARFVLVISSLSPLFVLWGIRGTNSVEDKYWVPICAALVILPNLFLWLMVVRTRSSNNNITFKITAPRDQREHLLVYLFAMLIPLYDANMGGARDLAAVSATFIFVAFLFWHLKLHYMNLIFAIKGYHIFTVDVQIASQGDSPNFTTYAVISKRQRLEEGMTLAGLRLGGNVVLDTAKI